ncbi:hypothetical protein OIU78_014920 [Salix suchowensis]|nr:hypothetical protein OIU78_014920 [Salix suchowensis]
MGLSSLPAPSEGVLCVILVNTALSISIVKGIVRSILHIVGIRLSPSSPSASLPSSDNAEDTIDSFEFHFSPPENYIEEFRSKMPSIRFDTVCCSKQPEHDCSAVPHNHFYFLAWSQKHQFRAVSSRKKFGDLFLATSSCLPTVLVPMDNLAGLHKNCEGMTSDGNWS